MLIWFLYTYSKSVSLLDILGLKVLEIPVVLRMKNSSHLQNYICVPTP